MVLHKVTLISRATEEKQKKDGTGSYKAIVVKYSSAGVEKTKTLVLSYVQKNNPLLVEKLGKTKAGDSLIVELEGQFQNLVNVYKEGEVIPGEVTIPKPPSSYYNNSQRTGYKEDPNKQASIIRQSCLKGAIELVVAGKTKDLSEVERVTKDLERFVLSVNPTVIDKPSTTQSMNQEKGTTIKNTVDFNEDEEVPF